MRQSTGNEYEIFLKFFILSQVIYASKINVIIPIVQLYHSEYWHRIR